MWKIHFDIVALKNTNVKTSVVGGNNGMAMSALEVMTDTESVLKSLKRHLEQLRDSDEIDHKTSTIKQLKGKNVKNIVKDSCSVVEVALKLCEQIMTNGWVLWACLIWHTFKKKKTP